MTVTAALQRSPTPTFEITDATGAMVEVNCETDFVTKNDSFLAFANAAAALVAERAPADVAALSALPLTQDGFGPTVEDVRKGLIGKIGENISVRRFKRYADGGKLASYLHGTRIGVLVGLKSGEEAVARDIAMHVAALNPAQLSAKDLPADDIAKEREIQLEQLKNDPKYAGKAEAMLDTVRNFLLECTYPSFIWL